MDNYDFRSDTVTKPTESMRQAMYTAEVGDDVYGDDPTVIKLEKLAASIVGKEAAIFVPSGTFGNQLAILSHTFRGDEVILSDECHIMMHEVGAASVIAGVQLRQFSMQNKKIPVDKIEQMIRVDDIHFPRTGLICLENAYSNGQVIDTSEVSKIASIAIRHDVPVHLDGARLFNASTFLNVPVTDLTKHADSVMFCLSKGLCAPIGSILAGSHAFISRARKNRKLMGGGLRQAGIIAAAGIIALNEMIPNIKKDHDNALYFAERLNTVKGITVLKERLDINMVFCNIEMQLTDKEFVEDMRKCGILINGIENGVYRFVTHYYTQKKAIDYFIDKIEAILIN